jgi:predicted dehydrogenase
LTSPPLRAGVVGFGWMGRVHAAAYRRVHHHYPQLGRRVELVAVADEEPGALDDARARLGAVRTYQDWRELVDAPDVDVVSVTAPNWLHREIGVAVARAGKHLWIEKPVGLSADDARAVAQAVEEAGVVGAVGFNYRHAPAVAHARSLLAAGALGDVTSARVRFLTDYAAHPDAVLSWRFQRERGGDGVLGDLASHAVDLLRFLLGDLDRVVAVTRTAIPRRPLATGSQGHYAVAAQDAQPGEGPPPTGVVENADSVVSLVRTRSGVTATLEASRVSVGDQNAYGFEVSGTAGRLEWDFRRMGELVLSGPEPVNAPRVHLSAGPGHGGYAAFQPGAGIAMGYDDLKVLEAAQFARAAAAAEGTAVEAGSEGSSTLASVTDALRSAEALDAMSRSSEEGVWVDLP